jgi:hypothetical protein
MNITCWHPEMGFFGDSTVHGSGDKANRHLPGAIHGVRKKYTFLPFNRHVLCNGRKAEKQE